LPALYERVLVPQAVLQELENARTPEVVRAWLKRPPQWLSVRETPVSPDPELDGPDTGERNAIQLAVMENARPPADGRTCRSPCGSQSRSDRNRNTGVLLQASQRGLVDIESALSALQATNFRATPALIEDMRRRAQTQKRIL
jgi:predicted nucleic acid-binding protein